MKGGLRLLHSTVFILPKHNIHLHISCSSVIYRIKHTSFPSLNYMSSNLTCSFMLCRSVWVTAVDQPKLYSALDIITHLEITMMEALKLFVLLSSQKAVVAWQSCILMSSEIHHTQRCSREINMNKSLLAPVRINSES